MEIGTFNNNLYKSQAMNHMIQCLRIKEQLEMRFVSQRFGYQMIPNQIKKFKLNFQEDDEEIKKGFHNYLMNVRRIEIYGINGYSSKHLEQLKIVCEKNSNSCQNLHLTFFGDQSKDNEEQMAQKFAQQFSLFKSIEKLRIDVEDEGNISNILSCMNQQEDHPWFNSVQTISLQTVKQIKNEDTLIKFIQKFKNLVNLNGANVNQLQPFKQFKVNGFKFYKLKWVIPSNEEQRNELFEYLGTGSVKVIHLIGGFPQKKEIQFDIKNLEGLQGLILENMPDVEVNSLIEQWPNNEWKILRFSNVESVNMELMQIIFAQLMSQKSLEELSLEQMYFELTTENFQNMLRDLLSKHLKSLKRISFAKNKLTTDWISSFLQEIALLKNQLEVIDLRHLEVPNSIDWCQILSDLQKIKSNSNKDLKLIVGFLDIYEKNQQIYQFMEENNIKIDIETVD